MLPTANQSKITCSVRNTHTQTPTQTLLHYLQLVTIILLSHIAFQSSRSPNQHLNYAVRHVCQRSDAFTTVQVRIFKTVLWYWNGEWCCLDFHHKREQTSLSGTCATTRDPTRVCQFQRILLTYRKKTRWATSWLKDKTNSLDILHLWSEMTFCIILDVFYQISYMPRCVLSQRVFPNVFVIC